MFKDIVIASGKTEGVIRSIFEYYDTHLKDSFWDLSYSVSKKYNMSMITAAYVYCCWKEQGVA